MYTRSLDLPARHSFFLFGPRLTGKSTLIRQSFAGPDCLYIDLLDPSAFQVYRADPGALEREVRAGSGRIKKVVIDEVQKVPPLLDVVQRLMESLEGRDIQFILTGSSARKLKRERANLLAGRAWSLELHPLTAAELGGDFDLERALSIGTLPAICSLPLEEAQESLRAYADTYLTEEIQAEAAARNLGAFIRFLPVAAAESGRVVNSSSIGRDIGLAYKTVQGYFEILRDTLLGFWLEPYAKSARRRLSRHPKFYFFDTGVLRALSKTLRMPPIRGTPEHGRLLEHLVINEARRVNSYRRLDISFCYYRTNAGAEVDLVALRPGKPPLAVEIKASPRPAPSDLSGLLSFAELEPKAELALACTVERPQELRAGGRVIRALPWRECLDLIR